MNVCARAARFFLVHHTKTGKIYLMTIKYTKRPQKYVYQMVIEYTNIFHFKTLQNLPKLGLKMYHLATLVCAGEKDL
jgi:hypothetical protein